MKTALKLLLIGLVATVVRIGGQFLIPAGTDSASTQTVLEPSRFVEHGTMPIVLSLYGIFAYAIIAALFLLVRDRMSGGKIKQGLLYGIACSIVWIVYLWEPLPHTSPIDRITYPLVDSAALLAMGLLAGLWLGNPDKKKTADINFSFRSILIVAICFMIGRLIQYLTLNIYSSFLEKTIETLTWVAINGLGVGFVMVWLNNYIETTGRFKRAWVLGVLLFGVDYFLFNFFMPIVFKADIPDLFLRTGVDILAVTVGCLIFQKKEFEKFPEFTG